jgi:hypothetical protein
VDAFVRMYGTRESLLGENEVGGGVVDPCGFGRRRNDSGGFLGESGPAE